jgi:hypothetical protein
MEKDATEPGEAAAEPNSGQRPSTQPTVRKPWPKEIGGAPGPEPTRYGDWEHKGRCTDF